MKTQLDSLKEMNNFINVSQKDFYAYIEKVSKQMNLDVMPKAQYYQNGKWWPFKAWKCQKNRSNKIWGYTYTNAPHDGVYKTIYMVDREAFQKIR